MNAGDALDTKLLREARARSRLSGRTVWDELVTAKPGSVAAWVIALRAMGIEVLEPQPGDRTGSASENDAGVWTLMRGAVSFLMLADPWDDALVNRAMSTSRTKGTQALIGTYRQADRLHPAWDGARVVGAGTDASPPPEARDNSLTGAGEAGDEVVRFVDATLAEAVDRNASDVHFECHRLGMVAKFRIDGVLREGPRLEAARQAQAAISRIKVLAQLDITEQRVPQDGRFRHPIGPDHSIDLRVSIMPSIHGEDAVLRLLDRSQLRRQEAASSLEALRFDLASVARIRDLSLMPHGMLLVTGPTGSGKTTTVYGVLSELNSGEEKIVTIEDPVEYELPGVLQIPVNERKGLTFARGLRSILRHDPDRILVGEIRDAETAEIAVQSALTGHQVFTTVHANNLFDVTGRFRHFGIDMFGFMAALNGVVVQRLLRSLCDCARERTPTASESAWLSQHGSEGPQTLRSPLGCERCGHTGYRGRMVLAEVHAVDDGLRDLVTSQAPISALRAHVARSGVLSLQQVAATAMAAGTTSMEEVRRVVGLA